LELLVLLRELQGRPGLRNRLFRLGELGLQLAYARLGLIDLALHRVQAILRGGLARNESRGNPAILAILGLHVREAVRSERLEHRDPGTALEIGADRRVVARR